MRSDSGFSLIEVLIALIIITSAIITLNDVFRGYSFLRQKQAKYENIYISVLSLKDKIDNMNLSRTFMLNGTINGLSYRVNVSRAAQRRNFVYGLTAKSTGNLGKFRLILYKIVIEMAGRKFEFYETKYEKT